MVSIDDGTDVCTGFQAAFSYQQNGSTFNFSDETNGGTANKWLWGFDDGTTSTEQNPTHTYHATGTFNVCLIAQDTLLNCYEWYCEEVTVTQVGIDNPTTANFQVYPNPFMDGATEITVTGIEPTDYQQPLEWTLYDVQGRIIERGTVTGQAMMAVPLPASLPEAMYFLAVQGTKQVYKAKLLHTR